MAKDCGFTAVKFQKRNPEISTPSYQKKIQRTTPWGEMTYLAYKKIEFGRKELMKLIDIAKKKKLSGFPQPGM